jgi:hypothetical protein
LLLLSGFSCSKKEQKTEPVFAGEDVLVSVDGKPILKLAEFKQYVSDATARDQNMAVMAQFMPDFEEKVFEGAAYPRIIFNEWAQHNNITSKEEYKKELEKSIQLLKDMLNQEWFVKAHVTEVTDSEIKKYYEENKEKDPGLMVSAGGVEAKGAHFAQEAQANEFFKKVQAHNGNIDLAAKDLNVKIVDLGKVNHASFVAETVKNKILEAKTMPAVLPVINEGGKEFWVVKVFKREPAKYRPLEQIKNALKEHLMTRKISETIQKLMPEYEQKYGISVNRTYFDRKRKEAAQKLQEAQAAAQAKAPQATNKELSQQQKKA